MIKIDKDVPIPDNVQKRTRPGPPRKYPFPDMEVGDSFVVGGDCFDPIRVAANVRMAAASYVNRNKSAANKLFSVIKQEDGTYRCWRVK